MNSQTHLKAVFQSSMTNVFILTSSLLSSTLLAQILGPEGRGELATILLWSSLFVTLGSLGLEKAVSYYASKLDCKTNKIFFTGLFLLAGLSVIVYVAGMKLVPYILAGKSKEIIQTTKFCMILVPIMFLGNLPYWVLQGLGRFKAWNSVRALSIWLWIIAIGFAYITNNKNAYFIAKGYVFAMVINCAIWVFVYSKIPQKDSIRINIEVIPDLFKYGFFSMLSILPNQLNTRLDQMVMSIILPVRDLGLYIVAFSWGGLLSPIMSGFAQVAFHKMLTSNEESRSEEFATFFKFSILVGFVCMIAIILLTPIVLPLIFGQRFLGSVIPAIILVFSSFFQNLVSLLDENIKGLGKPKFSALSQSMGLIIMVILVVPTLKYLGIIGASLLSLFTYIVVFLTMIFYLQRLIHFRFNDLLFNREDFLSIRNLIHQASGKINSAIHFRLIK